MLRATLLPFLLPLTAAVTLRNHENLGCSGTSLACTSIAAGFCCGHLSTWMNSVLATGLPPTGIASLHEKASSGSDCGTIDNSGYGLSLCLNANDDVADITGSTWHDVCSTTCKRDEVDEFFRLSKAERHERLGREECKGNVQPDKLVLSTGHTFEIGNGMAVEDVEVLLGLAGGKKGMKIDDVPSHLLKHMIGNETAARISTA